MVQTVYKKEYQDQISVFDFNMRPGPSDFARPDCTETNYDDCEKGTNPGRTYRFFVDKPVVPFGFGLSYSKFEYELISSPESVSLETVREALEEADGGFMAMEIGAKCVSSGYIVKVTNTGNIDADDVVLGFAHSPGAGKNGVPLKSLFGFERVFVRSGESVEVTLYPGIKDFTVVDKTGTRKAVEGSYRFSFGVEETSNEGGGFIVHAIDVY